MKPIYMDHHATTPMDPRVFDAMMPYLTDHFGNPSSSTHEYGRAARSAVEQAREQVAHLIGAAAAEEIVFTSGATEADNLAIKGRSQQFKNDPGRIISIETEHKAILDPLKQLQRQGFDVQYAKIDKYGLVDLDDLQSLLTPDTVLVSIQAANSEIGTVQPLVDIAALTRKQGIPLHTDAVQALGHVAIEVEKTGIDLLSISGHKIYGPKGVGALYVKKGTRLSSQIDGGGQERGIRSGTLNVPGIVGLGKAAEIARLERDQEYERLSKLSQRLITGIQKRIDYTTLNGHPTKRLPHNVNFSFAFVEGESLMLACKDVALSSGSACTSASLKSSYVLKAIGVPDSLAHCSIRFGLGRSNTREHIDFVLDLLEKQVGRLREMSPLYDMAKEGIDIDNFNWGDHSHDHE